MRKHILVTVVIAVLVGALWFTVSSAQDRADQSSMVELSKTYLQWMKAMAGKLDQALQQAREEQNTRKIDCIEDRLKSLRKVIGETEGMYQQLRALSLQQRTAEARKLFARVDLNRRLAEQILRLVDNCYENINEEGGFVETLEEWMGDPEDADLEEAGVSEGRDGAPEPLPNEFTPGPVSEEDEEF